MTPEPTVYIVDDDNAVRRFLSGLIGAAVPRVEAFASAKEFLDFHQPGEPGCLVLDVRMPGMSGLDLQKELKARGINVPIIFLTGHGDIPMAVQALKGGAYDFIEKPFDNRHLLERVQGALAHIARPGGGHGDAYEIARRLEHLSPREREVMEQVVAGETNKGVARNLGISDKTVEIHRANVMRKMKAKSLAALVRMTMPLGTAAPENPSNES